MNTMEFVNMEFVNSKLIFSASKIMLIAVDFADFTEYSHKMLFFHNVIRTFY